jgi:uncharacterized RDD family membrane protein YckC
VRVAGWVVDQRRETVVLPPGLKIAGLGARTGAWLLDGILSGMLAIVALIVAFASHGMSVNQDWLNAVSLDPAAKPNVPMLGVQEGPLIGSVVLFVVLVALYYAGCWALFRATPAQKLLSLQVADARTGRNVPFWRALIRWVVLGGAWTVVLALYMYLAAELYSRATVSDLANPNGLAYSNASAGLASGFNAVELFGLLSLLLVIVLPVSASMSDYKRGLHDRLAGTIVVGKANTGPAYAAPQYYAPGQVPPPGYGQPPQAYGQPPQGYAPPSGYGQPPQGYVPPESVQPQAPDEPPATSRPPVAIQPAAPRPTNFPGSWPVAPQPAPVVDPEPAQVEPAQVEPEPPLAMPPAPAEEQSTDAPSTSSADSAGDPNPPADGQ